VKPTEPTIDDEEEAAMPEYLIQATDNTMFAMYPSGKCRVLIYPELQWLEQKLGSDLKVVKTTNRENDQIISHRAMLP
jgi:hypothetical protein